MRPWAEWTAKTALLAAGFAAAGGGLSGVALAGTGGSNPSGNASVDSNNQVIAPVSIPADICGNAAAVLGDSTAGCAGGAISANTNNRSAGTAIPGTLMPGTLMKGVVAPVTSVLGSAAPLAGLKPVSGLTSLAGVTRHTGPLVHALGLGGPGAVSSLGPGSGSALSTTPNAGSGAGAGNATVPSASQLAGLGALPGLADLPSLAGLANMPALNGVTGGGIPMPGTALSATNAPGMSSDSFAALAVGALLAGASALKIAGGRARDRKAGIGVAI